MNKKIVETILILVLIIISLIYFVIDFSVFAVLVFFVSCILLKFSYPIEKIKKEEELKPEKKDKKTIVPKEKEEKVDNVPLINFPKDFEEKEFLKNVFLLYKEIQMDFMDFKHDELMEKLGFEMYEQFSKQMKSLESRNKQSVRVNIKLEKIQTISFNQEKDYYEAVIYLAVLEDKYMKEIEEEFRLTSARVRYESCYNITLLKRHKKKIVRKCHNCNEKVQGNPNKCPICNTMLLENSENWIMTNLKLVCSHSKKES